MTTTATEDTMNTITADYGTWADYGDGEATVPAYIGQVLGEYAGDYDLDGLTTAYAAAVNAALPDGVVLAGPEFIGPLEQREAILATDAIPEAVRSVDFWAIAAKFDRAAQ